MDVCVRQGGLGRKGTFYCRSFWDSALQPAGRRLKGTGSMDGAVRLSESFSLFMQRIK